MSGLINIGIMMNEKILAVIICLLFVCISCGYDDPYGNDRPMRLLNKDGEEIDQVHLSRWVNDHTHCYIVGGVGENYVIEVEDTSMVYSFCKRKSESKFIFKYRVNPTYMYISNKKVGSTTISVTDIDAGQTLHIPVHISDSYAALTILESNVGGYEENMFLAFSIEEDNYYRVLKRNGDEYASLEVGKYSFAEYSQRRNEEWELTLTCEDEVTVWRITDADNNEGGYKGYISDVVCGLRLPDPVTKWEQAICYPQKFRFTDIENPERSFITGPANLKIPDMF